MNSPEPRQGERGTDITPTLTLTADQTFRAAELSPEQYKQWIQTLELVVLKKQPSRTWLGHFFRPAETERKLVLFTLAIVVLTIVIGTMLYAATETRPNEALITALTTLAGTGLGFIGGMVAGNKEDTKTSDGGVPVINIVQGPSPSQEAESPTDKPEIES